MSFAGGLILGAQTFPVFREITEQTVAHGTINRKIGYSCAVDGDVAAVCALTQNGVTDLRGTVTFYARSGGTWAEEQSIINPQYASGDRFGCSVAVSGDTVVVGDDGDDDEGALAGAAYVYVRSGGGVWALEQKLTLAEVATGDRFGCDVSISGDTIVCGARDHAGQGEAFVFTRSGATWTKQASLVASDGVTSDKFAASVSIDGDTIVCGAEGDTAGAAASGSAYVFTRSGATWTQDQKLTASDAASGDAFGSAVSISGDTIAVGSDGKGAEGGAYVFDLIGGTWVEGQIIDGAEASNDIGALRNISLSGDYLALTRSGGTDSALVSVLTRRNGVWTASPAMDPGVTPGCVAIDGGGLTLLIGHEDNGDGATLGGAAIFYKT